MSVHPGHDDLVHYIENVAFKHFKYRDSQVVGPNDVNIHNISELYAEVVGELSKSRFMSVKKKFFTGTVTKYFKITFNNPLERTHIRRKSKKLLHQ